MKKVEAIITPLKLDQVENVSEVRSLANMDIRR
jgi:hypothetical protein